MSRFHPDLVSYARIIPDVSSSGLALTVLKKLTSLARAPRMEGVRHERFSTRGHDGHTVELFAFSPANPRSNAPRPALLWIHGGGYLIGHPLQDAALCAHFARELGATVIAPRYRLAPEHPFPAPIEDCYAALQWIGAQSEAMQIDLARVAIGGASAGGGLASALALMARDRDGVKPCFQLLTYPMLDDKTALRTDLDESHFRLWKQRNNRIGWRSYLGREPGAEGVSMYAAAARAESLAGLCPAWVGVGTLDLFLDEDLAYAARLKAEGVPCDVLTVDGAFHGFDLAFPKLPVSAAFRAAQTEALRRALAR